MDDKKMRQVISVAQEQEKQSANDPANKQQYSMKDIIKTAITVVHIAISAVLFLHLMHLDAEVKRVSDEQIRRTTAIELITSDHLKK